MDRRHFIALCGMGTAGLLLSSCDDDDPGMTSTGSRSAEHQLPADVEAQFAQFTASDEPDGNPDAVTWPEFVLAAPPEVQELYEFHVTNGGLMRYMPCYCGCKGSNHRNNRDCYIKAVHADGSLTFDSMAPT